MEAGSMEDTEIFATQEKKQCGDGQNGQGA